MRQNDECGHLDKPHDSHGMCANCAQMARYYANRPAHIARSRAANIRRNFGVTQEWYDRQEALQDGKCAICGKPCVTGRRLAIDHNHKTGMVRALLCTRCNNGLGNFGDDHELLQKAIDYLASWKD
jgi:hypothetical protein